jgi:hypothetical protein
LIPVPEFPGCRQPLPYPPVLKVKLPAFSSRVLRNQFPLDKLIELVKVNVAEDRGNNAAL